MKKNSLTFELMLQFDCGLGSVIIYLFFFFFWSSSGFFFDSEGAKKRVLRVRGNVQRKILCNWIDNLYAVYEFHVQILTIFKLNMKGWMGKDASTPQALYFA